MDQGNTAFLSIAAAFALLGAGRFDNGSEPAADAKA